jgi:hypothetical protein
MASLSFRPSRTEARAVVLPDDVTFSLAAQRLSASSHMALAARVPPPRVVRQEDEKFFERRERCGSPARARDQFFVSARERDSHTHICERRLSAIFATRVEKLKHATHSTHELMTINGHAFEALSWTPGPAGRMYQESISGS